MPDIIGLLKNFFGAIAEGFGFARQKETEKNSPEVQAAAQAQDEASAQDRTKQAIASRDYPEIQREMSE